MNREIEINKIIQNENSRTKFKDKELFELMDSIKQHGLLQPIGVKKNEDKYEIIFGNRRFIACKKLGHTIIEANIIEDIEKETTLILNLVENIQRKDISPIEEGRIVSKLLDLKLTYSEIAARLSICVTRIKKSFFLFNSIPEKYRSKIIYIKGNSIKKGNIGSEAAFKIMNMKKEYGLKNDVVENLFEIANKDDFTTKTLINIAQLLRVGFDAKEAIKYADKIRNIEFTIPLFIEDVKKAEKYFEKNIHAILKDIIYNGILYDGFKKPKCETKNIKKINLGD